MIFGGDVVSPPFFAKLFHVEQFGSVILFFDYQKGTKTGIIINYTVALRAVLWYNYFM